VAIERVNSRLRHWFARFRRRTCVVSKALEMVDATSLPPTTLMEQRQNSPCHCLLNTLHDIGADLCALQPLDRTLDALIAAPTIRQTRDAEEVASREGEYPTHVLAAINLGSHERDDID
jgi:hypothetical protein